MPDNEDRTTLAVIQNDISYIKKQLDTIDTKVGNTYVTKDQFEPVRNLVYGVVTVILVSVIGAVVALVVK